MPGGILFFDGFRLLDAAYLMMHIYRTDILGNESAKVTPAQQALVDTERKILPELLRIGQKKQ